MLVDIEDRQDVKSGQKVGKKRESERRARGGKRRSEEERRGAKRRTIREMRDSETTSSLWNDLLEGHREKERS